MTYCVTVGDAVSEPGFADYFVATLTADITRDSKAFYGTCELKPIDPEPSVPTTPWTWTYTGPDPNQVTRYVASSTSTRSTLLKRKVWTFRVTPEITTACGCAEDLTNNVITKSCPINLYLTADLTRFQLLYGTLLAKWSAGFTAAQSATVVVTLSSTETSVAKLSATLTLHQSGAYGPARDNVNSPAVTNGNFLYFTVEVPNSPVNADLRVAEDGIFFCQESVVDPTAPNVGETCVQQLMVDAAVVDNRKPAISTRGVVAVAFPRQISQAQWRLFVQGILVNPGTAHGNADSNKGTRRLLQDQPPLGSFSSSSPALTVSYEPDEAVSAVSAGSTLHLSAAALCALVMTAANLLA